MKSPTWTRLSVLAVTLVVVLQVIDAKKTTTPKPRRFDAVTDLEKFGYLDDLNKGEKQHDPQNIKRAIKEFQKFNGLRMTGRLDQKTVKKMQSPRCGLPDVMKPGERPAELRGNDNPNAPLAFYAPGYKWPKNDITYKFIGYSPQMDSGSQRREIREAFDKWSEVTPLTFTETRGDADIEINFARRQHGDGAGNAFDGRGGTLAHAFFPGQAPISGDTHFDEDELWTLRGKDGTNLEIVATHEFGHALGLGHSSNPEALMAPFYKYDPQFKLSRDDVNGIQSLYGRGSGVGRRTQRPPVTRPTTTSRPRTTDPAICSLKFDAISQIHDGNIIAFKRRELYYISMNGPVNKTRIRNVFKGAPSSPGAVVYDRNARKLFIFKGRRYWRYTGYKRDPGYPKTLPAPFQKIRAAMQWRDGRIYLFKGGVYMRWTETLTTTSTGYPRRTKSYWQKFPYKPEAAFRSYDSYYYVFKGKRVWRYNYQAGLSKGYPRKMAPIWLNCGRSQRLSRKRDFFSFITKTIQPDKI